jgi:6-phosphogluconolactonase
MVYESLLAQVPVIKNNILRMPGELPPELGAARYEESLRDLFDGQDLPDFDLVLLGLGEDGHVASLFPGSPALGEKQHWVVAADHDQPPPPLVPRLSVTIPVINAARNVLFLVAGANKAAILARIFHAQGENTSLLPAQRIRPSSGMLTWMVDADAAQYFAL